MDLGRQTRVRQAFDTFFGPAEPPAGNAVLELFHRTAETVPAYRKFLSDEQIAAVSNYVRGSWGNRAGAVSPKDVKAQR